MSNLNKNNNKKKILLIKKPLKGKGPIKNKFWSNVLSTFIIFFILISIYSVITDQTDKTNEIAISELAQDIKGGLISQIVVMGDKLEINYLSGEVKLSKKEINAPLSDTLINYGVASEELAGIKIDIQRQTGFGFWFLNLAPFLIPLLFIIFIIWFLTRQVKGAGMQAFTFGQSKARIISPDDSKQRIKFKDIAGNKEAKEELKEIVDFLKNPKKFLEIGARIPKGVLLMGPSGTGKTMLARGVAGEAGVAFFSISGSEFVEMFVGVGASVTGDTPVLVKEGEKIKLVPISEFVDQFYKDGSDNHVKKIKGFETLGFKSDKNGFFGSRSENKKFFGGSEWSKVEGVLRHKVKEIYEIEYNGGKIKATGDHSIFVRQRNMIAHKKASELKRGDILVNLPFKVRGAFMPGIGTIHKVKAHQFSEITQPQYLDVYEQQLTKEEERYEMVLAHKTMASSYNVASDIGVSQTTIINWWSDKHTPRFINDNQDSTIPLKVEINEDLMRLLGYYTAEGNASHYYSGFTFGSHESDLHEDCISLIKKIFNVEPSIEIREKDHTFRIRIHSSIVSKFFEKQCGKGAHGKHIPGSLWLLPKRYFLAYLYGYSRGDGYTTIENKLSVTSVSKQLIQELAWLASMHGMQAGIKEEIHPAGRVIAGGKPLPETKSWSLIFGQSTHPFIDYFGPKNQFKKPIVKKVTKIPFDGYVYDLCGCDNEAFFGGQKPTLLSNSRVRDLFKMAKHAAPAIIFIDEIDAVGRVRGTGVGGGNDEREQTLNQILVEMDGFEPNEKVIIMAATNRPDVLDPALVRPGRFDRRVVLDLPDRGDREEILKIHSVGKPFAEDVNLTVIAERTPGFSGADLYSLMNEGAILAARESRNKISQYDLIRSIEKVMLGPERKSHLLSKQEKEITAYHEGGHALVASILPNSDPVHKVSIISRGRAAGYTLKLPIEDRKMQSRKEFLDDIAVSLGGYVAEKMVFNDLTTGSSNDLQVATALARDMVTRYGMSDKLGAMTFEGAMGRTMFGRGLEESEYSEKVAADIDAEVSRIMKEAYSKTEQILTEKRNILDAIAKRLVEVETIERDDFEQILIANGIQPKKKEEEV